MGLETLMSLEAASAIARNAAQALGLICFAGFLAGLVRWPHAKRLDFLLAFLVFMFGTVVAQLPVYIGGMTGWGVDLVLLSGVGRWTQNLGGALFIRVMLLGQCPPWTWKAIVLLVVALTVVL